MKLKTCDRPGRLLYLITSRQNFHHNQNSDHQRAPGERAEQEIAGQLEAIRVASSAGCQLVQVREKDLSAGELTRFTRQVIAVARPRGTRVLVNDRVDIALASGADGVHLRSSSLPAEAVRRIAGLNRRVSFLIGVSTHSVDEALQAESGGADFIVCGPVFPTPSKVAYGPPMGVAAFAAICQRVKIPVFALGGIDWLNYQEPLAAGASGIAGIGLFRPTPDLPDKIRQFCQPNGVSSSELTPSDPPGRR